MTIKTITNKNNMNDKNETDNKFCGVCKYGMYDRRISVYGGATNELFCTHPENKLEEKMNYATGRMEYNIGLLTGNKYRSYPLCDDYGINRIGDCDKYKPFLLDILFFMKLLNFFKHKILG